MTRGEAEKRLDAHYNLPEYRLSLRRLLDRYPESQRLDNYASVFCGPFGTEITGADYREAGVPMLRITNITKEGMVDETDLVFLTEQKATSLVSTQVVPGDLVISQRGTLGMPAVVPDDYPAWNISANLVAISRVSEVSPAFVQLYLSSSIGGSQLARCQSGQVQGKITTGDVASVLIPKVDDEARFVADMDAAREARRETLARADALLSGLDGYLLEQLGLTAPAEDKRLVYAVRLKETASRFDPAFYRPDLYHLTKTLQSGSHARLGELVRFSSETWNPLETTEKTFRYIEISGINLQSGQAIAVETPVADAPSRARMRVREGDVIVSTTRPHHGAIALIDADKDEHIASTGFAVIRDVTDKRINREYLWCVLRSRLCLRQMLQRSSGGNYPAITQQELAQVLIPIPEPHIRDNIVTEIHYRQAEARRLRQQAETEWAAAKARFEQRLLGEGT